jgi:hypothetical protein
MVSPVKKLNPFIFTTFASFMHSAKQCLNGVIDDK